MTWHRSTDRSRKASRGPLRIGLGVVGLVSLLAAGVGVSAHFFGPVSTVVTLLAAFSPLFVVLAVVSMAVLMAARLWIAAVAALIVVVVGVAAELPLFVADGASAVADAPKVRLLQANIRLGEADPNALVSRVRTEAVDVLTVSELTVASVDRLAAAGMAESLPFSYLLPREGGGGEGIYSRYPLTETAELPGLHHNNLRAAVELPGARPFALYALHPLPPYPEPAWRWASELDRIATILAAEPLPLVIGADFNSTYDHERYRNLLHAGARDGSALIDAADYLGSGIVATFPADKWYPAVLAIDRVLARGATPMSFRRVSLPGSDHFGVLADVLLVQSARRGI